METKEGKKVITLFYPRYEKQAVDYLKLLEPDMNYDQNYNNSSINTLPTEMRAQQIQTMFTFILRGEKFSEGLFDSFIQNGSILKYFLRLDDLLTKLD